MAVQPNSLYSLGLGLPYIDILMIFACFFLPLRKNSGILRCDQKSKESRLF